MPATRRFAVCLVGLLGSLNGCGEDRGRDRQAPPEPAVSAPSQVTQPAPREPQPARAVLEDFDDGGSETEALRRIRALPAWSAVIDRYRFLERRGDVGVVHGLLVEDEGGYRLVDETEGSGALSVPVALPSGLDLELPMRAVLWGAWTPTSSPSWTWSASRVARLRDADAAPAVVPPLSAAENEAPADTVIASQVSRRGGTISFVVIERSPRVGDGWIIADGSEGPPVARLLLPGELETYGDQSEPAEDERWQLGKNVRYWVSIRSVRGGKPGKLPVYRARSAPYRDDDAPAPQVGMQTAPSPKSDR